MADGQGTTLFNFEPVLDHVRETTDRIASDYVSVPRFNQILIELGKQATLFADNKQAVEALRTDVANFTTLLQALIQALSGVATLDLQHREIALLRQLIPQIAESGDFNPGSAVITGP